MSKVSDNNKLAIQMLIAMVSGILVGLLFMAGRESLGADSAVWAMLNKILFQDITASGAESAIGIFLYWWPAVHPCAAADHRSYGVLFCGYGYQRNQ